MTGINASDLLDYVITPALEHLNLDSPEARALVLGTGMAESGLGRLVQIQGPALGLWQCEPATHLDIWLNYLYYRRGLRDKVNALRRTEDPLELTHNLLYAAAICRIHYYRVPVPLPTDAAGMARYWKLYYNSVEGKGSVEKAMPSFEEAVRVVNS